MTGSVDPAAFDDLYAGDDDPWGYESRWYERRKYALTLAALPRERYRRAFEPACSIGVLTEELARRCDELVAADVAERALAVARRRLAGRTQIALHRWRVPADWPDGTFDLVLLGELGYFLDEADLAGVLDRAAASLEPGGDLVAVHWRHPSPDLPLDGDRVHAAIDRRPELRRRCRYEEDDFVLQAWVRT